VDILKGLGYSIKDACKAVGISRSSYYLARRNKETTGTIPSFRDNGLVEKIKEIKTEHPFWVTGGLQHG